MGEHTQRAERAREHADLNHNPGVFITFEGGDGVGKTTQATLLRERLDAGGVRTLRTFEPGGTALGASVRDLLLHGDYVSPRAEALLYAADRAHHIATVVRPALVDGVVVIQDRYLDSSVAYQGAGRALEAAEIRDLSMWAVEGLLPDVTVLLDAPTSIAAARVAFEKGSPDRLEAEKAEFHERVRAKFRELAAAEPERWLVVDATQTAEAVAEEIAARVLPLVRHLRGGAR